MGSIISGPKSPNYSTRTIIREVPVYQERPVDNEAQDNTESSSKQRTENLLRRQRGRFGTVLTGLRGVLSEKTDTSNSRKTLLGE
ncbi:MAG: hypothetical protein CL565_05370 [Alphaproteobacteria bacterium]|nr:hypothetical protein [Alphaproteobacteria bacterium]|tara:strand:+ start:988 stop:1242 length:255 start_codon:yes stop_codon:yes gene_type:complete